MSNEITTKDLSHDEYESLQKFEGLLEEYGYAQREGSFKERVDARRALKQAFLRALKHNPNNENT
jgi:hypothetical protein